MREDQVDDQLHLVDALEVRVLRLIARLDQRVKAGLHQGGHAAAQDGLLAEQVGLGLLAEGGLEDAGARAADARGVGQRIVLRLAGGVLIHGDEVRHALALEVLAADGVARALRGDHDDVDVLRGLNAAEMNVKAVGERKCFTLGKVGLDAFLIKLSLLFVVDKNHNNVSLSRRFGRGHNRKTLRLSLSPAL